MPTGRLVPCGGAGVFTLLTCCARHTTARVEVRGQNPQNYVGSGEGTQVLGLRGKHLYLLSYLTSPRSNGGSEESCMPGKCSP